MAGFICATILTSFEWSISGGEPGDVKRQGEWREVMAGRRDQAADPSSAAPARMVTLAMPADQDFLALARTSVMHVASVLLLPLARVGDLRLAVDEACSLFLQSQGLDDENEIDADGAPPRPTAAVQLMQLSYDLYPEFLHVTVSAPVPADWPDRGELGWAILRTLVGDLRVSVEDGIGALTLIEPLPTAADI